MNLYLFPESASLNNGYGICVDFAYKRLKPNDDDIIIWNTNNIKIPFLKTNDYVIPKPPMYSYKRIKNILLNKYNLELSVKDLVFLKKYNFNSIHSDEVTFYRALRDIFPDKHLSIRFHNCFARIKDRKAIINASLNFKYTINLHSMYLLEKEIFNDRNATKIFVSEEDMNYYSLMTGYTNDAEVWSLEPDLNLMKENQKEYKIKNKLVWFGGVEAHKKKSIEWFIKEVYSVVKKEIPDVEFHLFGKNTDFFNTPKDKIFGHGFYAENNLPYKGEALFINPDIIGGGIKIKLLTYFNEGVPFISTPFGYEGYNKNLIDNKYCFVIEIDKWPASIITFLRHQNKP